MVIKTLKSVTLKELIEINMNSEIEDFNRTIDIEEIINEGIIIDDENHYYPVGHVMLHKNYDDSICIRVNIIMGNHEGYITDITIDDYENLILREFELCKYEGSDKIIYLCI